MFPTIPLTSTRPHSVKIYPLKVSKMNVRKLTDLFCMLARLDTSACFSAMIELLRCQGYTIDACSQEHYAICTPPKPHAVALVAHCDTVGKEPPEAFSNRCGVLTTKDGGVMGADDRAGCAAIAASVIDGNRPQIFLLTGEERGGIGADFLAYKTEYAPPDTLHVMLELDRQDSNDFVTYDCDSKHLNKWCKRFGWAEAVGSFTDISILAPAWGIAAANLSVGYYGQHSRSESLIVPQLAYTVDRVAKMLTNPPQQRIEYVEVKRQSYRSVSGYGSLWSKPTTESDRYTYADDEPIRVGFDDDKCLSCEKYNGKVNGSGWCLDCEIDFEIAKAYRLANEAP